MYRSRRWGRTWDERRWWQKLEGKRSWWGWHWWWHPYRWHWNPRRGSSGREAVKHGARGTVNDGRVLSWNPLSFALWERPEWSLIKNKSILLCCDWLTKCSLSHTRHWVLCSGTTNFLNSSPLTQNGHQSQLINLEKKKIHILSRNCPEYAGC